MPSTYTTSLKLTLPATGELAGTWGTTVNTGITTLVDDAVAGTASITVGGSDYTLTNTDGAANEARKMFITATGTPGAARNVIVPAVSKLYFVFNNTTGGFALTFKTSGGTGIAVAAGARMVLYCDGTNVVNALNAITLASPLPTSSGGTGLSSFTANRVFYSSSTSAIGSSANLTFDGSTLATSAFTATGNVSLNGGTFVFNDAGADLDARFEGDTDSTLLFLDASTDRVGIGLNNPAAKLHLGNNLTTTNTIPFQIGYAADFYGYRLINTSNPGSTAAGTFSIQRGTTTAWVDVLTSDNSGNVAFGNSSANNRMLVYTAGVNASYLQVANGSTGVGATQGVRLGVQAGGTAELITDLALAVSTGNLERVRVTSSGDVGIGTATPGAKFHVFGAAKVGTGAASNSHTLMVNNPNGTGTALQLFQDSQESWAMGLPASSTALTWSNSGTERMRITSSGDVGIGTATPGVKLHVKSTAAESARIEGTTARGSGSVYASFYDPTGRKGYWGYSTGIDDGFYVVNEMNAPMAFFTNAAERMRIAATGEVGIGTSSPAQILDIVRAQNAGTAAVVRNGNTGASASAQIIVNADTATGRFAAYSSGAGALANHISIEQTTNNPITFYTNSSERVRITGTGDVGIGTNSPASKLHVVGNFLRIDQSGSNQVYLGNAADLISGAPAGGALRFDGTALRISAGSTQVMHVTSGGDVGIGTSSPGSRLTVKGTATITVSDVNSYAASFGNDALGAVAVGSDASNGYIQSFAGRALKLNNQGNAVHVKPAYDNTTATAANVVVESDGYLKRSTSSLRYKRDVQDATHGLSEVLKLRSVTYKGKNDGEKVIGGLIAEEVDAAGLHEFVAYDEEGRPDALHYGNMVSLLVKAVQELKAELDVAKARIAALEAQ